MAHAGAVGFAFRIHVVAFAVEVLLEALFCCSMPHLARNGHSTNGELLVATLPSSQSSGILQYPGWCDRLLQREFVATQSAPLRHDQHSQLVLSLGGSS